MVSVLACVSPLFGKDTGATPAYKRLGSSKAAVVARVLPHFGMVTLFTPFLKAVGRLDRYVAAHVCPLAGKFTDVTLFCKHRRTLEFAVRDHVRPVAGKATLLTPARKRLARSECFVSAHVSPLAGKVTLRTPFRKHHSSSDSFVLAWVASSLRRPHGGRVLDHHPNRDGHPHRPLSSRRGRRPRPDPLGGRPDDPDGGLSPPHYRCVTVHHPYCHLVHLTVLRPQALRGPGNLPRPLRPPLLRLLFGGVKHTALTFLWKRCYCDDAAVLASVGLEAGKGTWVTPFSKRLARPDAFVSA